MHSCRKQKFYKNIYQPCIYIYISIKTHAMCTRKDITPSVEVSSLKEIQDQLRVAKVFGFKNDTKAIKFVHTL